MSHRHLFKIQSLVGRVTSTQFRVQESNLRLSASKADFSTSTKSPGINHGKVSSTVSASRCNTYRVRQEPSLHNCRSSSIGWCPVLIKRPITKLLLSCRDKNRTCVFRLQRAALVPALNPRQYWSTCGFMHFQHRRSECYALSGCHCSHRLRPEGLGFVCTCSTSSSFAQFALTALPDALRNTGTAL